MQMRYEIHVDPVVAEGARKALEAMLRVGYVFLRFPKYFTGRDKTDKYPERWKEILEIYSPLAHRLGFLEINRQIEDLAFPLAFPQEYKLTKKLVGKRQKKLENYLKTIIPKIGKHLKENNILLITLIRIAHRKEVY